MKVGIIGRVGSGRSSLFSALTGQKLGPASAKTRLGIARVQDERVDKLVELYKPRSTVYAEVALALPPNNTAAALDATALREMRDLSAYAHVVGAFSGDDPAKLVAAEAAELTTEMVLADMERLEKRIKNIKKSRSARPGEEALLERADAQLSSELPLRLAQWTDDESGMLTELGLLSHRPVVTVANVAEDAAGDEVPADMAAAAVAAGAPILWLSVPLELEIAGLDQEMRTEFLEAYGLTSPASARFVLTCLELLDQICFFTVGADEVRAWPLQRGAHAKRAARTIHSDLEKGFIRAEIFTYADLMEQGNEAAIKAAGKLRQEGKVYIVQDGDIINVRFNV